MGGIVRVGVVGTSWWAEAVHLSALASHAGARTVAICGRNRSRAEEVASRFSIPNVFTDYREMIARGGLDALVVCAPDDLHYRIAMQALDARLHLLCEKPVAMNARDARAMWERAESADVTHMTCFTYRWMPWYRYVKQLLEQDPIGRCYHCAIRCIMAHGRSAQYAWRFDRTRSNGVVADLGSHMVDLARWFVGDITGVYADLAAFVDRGSIEGKAVVPANDSALLAVRFANGAHGTIQASAVAHTGERGQEQHVALHGEKGTIEVEMFSDIGAEIRLARQDGGFQSASVPDELWGNVDRAKPMMGQLMEMLCTESVGPRLLIDAILAGRKVVPSLKEGCEAQRVIDAALESHEKGRWVRLE
jgi:predicted dehydrogenase